MTIDKIHDIILFLVNKEQIGYFSPEEIDMMLDRESLGHFNDLYNNYKTWSPGRPVPVVGYGESQRINDALAPFKAKYDFTTSGLSGVVTLPTDYMYLISLRTSRYNSSLGRTVNIQPRVLNEEELVMALESQVDPVSLDGPVAIMNAPVTGARKIQLFPDTVTHTGSVYYFKRPAAPKFAYTQSGRVITYDSGNSVQLEWSDTEVNAIISKVLAPLGLNMSAQDISQYAELKTQQGK